MRQLKKIAFGEMGMTELDFRKSSPEYFMLRLSGMRDRQRNQTRELWEIARYSATRSLAPYMKKVPAQFWKLPWDVEMTFDDWDDYNKMMDDKFPMTIGQA